MRALIRSYSIRFPRLSISLTLGSAVLAFDNRQAGEEGNGLHTDRIRWSVSILLLAGLLLFGLAGSIAGQERRSLPLDSLESSLIRIQPSWAGIDRFQGQVVGSRNDTLQVRWDQQHVEIPLAQIDRLEIATDEGNRAGGFLLGAVIGGAVGGLGTYYGTLPSGGADVRYGSFVLAFKYGIPLGAFIGGAVGYTSWGPNWEEIEVRR